MRVSVTSRPTRFPRWTPEEYRSRPRDLDPVLAEQICDRVANGETLSEICDDRDMPLPATFLRWTRDDPDTGRLWRAAQLDRLDVMAEECVVIANGGDAFVARNQMASRHWLTERMNPKKYAQRQISVGLTQTDEDEGGVDYGAEVRRKLETMAARRAEEQRESVG